MKKIPCSLLAGDRRDSYTFPHDTVCGRKIQTCNVVIYCNLQENRRQTFMYWEEASLYIRHADAAIFGCPLTIAGWGGSRMVTGWLASGNQWARLQGGDFSGRKPPLTFQGQYFFKRWHHTSLNTERRCYMNSIKYTSPLFPQTKPAVARGWFAVARQLCLSREWFSCTKFMVDAGGGKGGGDYKLTV